MIDNDDKDDNDNDNDRSGRSTWLGWRESFLGEYIYMISVNRVATIIIQIIKCAAVLRCPLLQHQSDAGH